MDYLWKITAKHQLSIHTLWILFELPGKQTDQVRERLKKHTYDVVIVSQPYSHAIYEKLAKEYPNTLFVNRTHGWEARLIDIEEKFDRTSNLLGFKKIWKAYRSRKVRSFCRKTIESCRAFIAPSTRCMNYVKDHYQINLEKTAVIPYGLDEDYLNANLSSRVESEALRLLYVGNYLPVKGSGVLEELLPKIAKKQNVSMTFVVQPPAVTEIEQKYRRLFGVRLNVRPWMSRRDLKQLYLTHDVLLFPSLFEGYGKTVLEAMAMGVCVIGFDEGGISDVAKSSETALFCKTGDLDAFEKNLMFALENPKEVQLIGEKAHEAMKNNSWDKAAMLTEDFCRNLLKQKIEGASK